MSSFIVFCPVCSRVYHHREQEWNEVSDTLFTVLVQQADEVRKQYCPEHAPTKGVQTISTPVKSMTGFNQNYGFD